MATVHPRLSLEDTKSVVTFMQGKEVIVWHKMKQFYYHRAMLDTKNGVKRSVWTSGDDLDEVKRDGWPVKNNATLLENRGKAYKWNMPKIGVALSINMGLNCKTKSSDKLWMENTEMHDWF